MTELLTVTRRGLFATLLAPLVARFAPKPKMSACDVIWECSQPFAPNAFTLEQLNRAYNAAWAGTVRPDIFYCVPEEDNDFAHL